MKNSKIRNCAFGLAMLLGSGLASASVAITTNKVANPQHYPADEWQEVTAAAVNLDQTKIDHLFDLSFEDSATQGVAFFKNGLLVSERYAEGYDKIHMALHGPWQKVFMQH